MSLWVSATASDYRQVAAGAKLALAERGGRAGVFRVNYAGKQVADEDPARATVDAVTNARTSLQDTQAGAVITNVGVAQAEQAITLLNEAGISTVALGDEALKRAACSSRSDIYPNGHETAIVVTDEAPMRRRSARASARASASRRPMRRGRRTRVRLRCCRRWRLRTSRPMTIRRGWIVTRLRRSSCGRTATALRRGLSALKTIQSFGCERSVRATFWQRSLMGRRCHSDP